MSDLIMKVKRNSAGAPDFSTAVEIEPKEYDPCGTCKHNGKSWHEEPCDGCCGNHSGYEPIGDLISRQAAIDALGEEPPVWYDGDDEIAERNQWRRDKAAIEALVLASDAINALTSDEATQNMKAWNGLYIKVYADDDPQDKAEKLYQICDSNEALSEVVKCIQGYLDEPSADYERATDQMEHDIAYEPTYNPEDGSM